MINRRNTLLLAGALSVVLVSAPATAQEVTLKFSHYLTDRHGLQTDFIEPWAKDLAARTGNKVKIEIYPVTSAFGNAARQADQVKAGVIDIAIGLRGIPRGRFEKSSVFELPFVVSNAGAGTRALWELYKDGTLASDYDGFKVLALFVHHGGLVHTLNKPVKSLEDMRGLRLRTPSDAVSAMLEFLGASPVGLPPAQIYESLQKNVIDGVVTTWDLVGAAKLNELVKYHTDARLYTATFYIVMNQAKYDSLPADVKKAIDETTGDALVAKFGDWWNAWDARGLADAKARNSEIITINEDTRAKWRAQLKPMIDKYIADMEAKGIKDARAIYERAAALVAKYEKK